MRLDFIEVSGFRGFREKVRVEFGAGFTVVTGRNGVGKSTLCDAVEFALLGEITKYSIESAAKETVHDYVWWRGEGAPDGHYVKAGFVDTAGALFVVTRSRESGADKTPEQIEAVLCQGAFPEDPLRQLCRTSVIRDEWIASLSLDLSETQRFDLVRAALGSVEGADLAERAKSIVSLAEAALKRVDETYEQARTQLSEGLVQLSEASDAAAKSSDVSSAILVLDSIVAPNVGDLAQRLDVARRTLPQRHRRLDGLSLAAFEGRELAHHQRTYHAPEAQARRDGLKSRFAEAKFASEQADAAVELAARAYEVEARADEVAASLTTLIEHGERLGLHDDGCPLCAAHRSQTEFEAGLAKALARVTALATNVSAAASALSRARAAAAEHRRIFAELQGEIASVDHEAALLRQREQAHIEMFDRYGLEYANAADPDALDRHLSREREDLLRVEAALNALEASRAVTILASVDARVAEFRRQADIAAEALSRAQEAVAKAKALEKSVRRVSSEIVDERLARISPLLNELYQRLRPHANWRTIDYSIRGDVRRFLSLKVGGDLNPQFVFSSGQRRAAGLAFLLSVHLARPWAKWQTLLLDDPVQHIDDFRALQLVEVLAALRQKGKQVIVAVEDEALADLLCRRLLSTPEQGGRRITIDYGAGGSAEVAARLDVPVMEPGILRNFKSPQAIA
jgi:chromosome segregation protein